ncbi:MAG: histidinol-phosphatase family [Solirubrobacteraceae bacterium]|nr:histidinol-phosphatase family [Solirubrobacteraceae bacterium]
MLTDYHLHLRPDDAGSDAATYFTAANAERYRAAAAARGIAELGCAEHVYRFAQALEVWQHPLWRESAVDDIDDYAAFVREQTDLKLGIEADFVAGSEDAMAALLAARDWDFVVGSVHFVGEHAVDHDGYEVWDHRGAGTDALWERYFQTLGEAARCGLFDVLAHPDLVKLWGARRPSPDGDLRRFYDLAMDGIAESQIAVELSTAGLRKPVGELYPAPAFLRMCVDAGCPVALSSDAHVPEDVGRDYDAALELLSELGVRDLAVFERRQRRLEAIG